MALRWLRGAAAPGRRRLRALLLGVAILWTAYVIGINAFLATGWIQHEINTSQGAAVITWGPAWSLIPARVHVRDFAVRVADRTNIEFLIHLDRASAWVDLPALLHRTFHANGVDADGVQLRIRFDYEPYHRAAAEREMPLLPTIEGYADPPLASYVVGTPPPNRATSHMWMVNLTRVRVSHLDEVWIQQFRWTGEATAAGQFHLLPELELGVGPAEAHFLSGGIRLGKSGLPVAASLTGPFSTTIHTFDIQGLRHALDFLHFVDTDGDLALAGSDLAWVNHFLAGAEIERGKGPLRFRPVLREGRFAPGAEIAFDTPEVELVTKPVRVSAGVHLRGRASPGLGLTTELRVEARRLAVGLGSSHGQRLVGGEGRFTVRAARLDLADLALDSEMRLDVGGLRTDDLTSWTEVERIRGIDPVGGSAQVDASWFKPRERLGRGRVVVRAPELTTRIGGTSIDGPAELDVEMEAGPPRSPPLIKLDGTRLDLGNPDGGAWWGRAAIDSGELELSHGGRFSGDVSIRGENAKPIAGLVAGQRSLPGWALRAFTSGSLGGQGHVVLTRHSFSADPFQIESGKTDVVGRLHLESSVTKGALLVRAGPFALGLGITPQGTKLHLVQPRHWFRTVSK